MSIFSKDLVEREVIISEDNIILGNRLTYMGVLPSGADTSKFIYIDRNFLCDPTTGNVYVIT